MFIYKSFPLVAILAFALLIRLVFLEQIPPGLTNDEANIIMNAQSILKNRENIPGVVTGIFGKPRGDLSGGIHSEISSYLIIPFIAIFGFSLLGVKLAFILAGTGIVLIGFMLVKNLVNSRAGLIAAILLSINPWLIHFGRSSYESIFSAFFYLTAIYLVVSKVKWKIFWSIPFFILGFLSYFSAKTLLVPIILVLVITFKFSKPKESPKPLIILFSLIIMFVLIYSIFLYSNPSGTRLNELKEKTNQSIVNANRTASLNLPFIFLFENKLIENFRIRFNASLGTLSPTLIFLNGKPESTPALSIPDHGPLYLIDLPLILIAFFALSISNRKALFIFGGLILTTLLPNFLNLAGTTYMLRTVIFFPLLTMLSAIGLYYLQDFAIKRKLFNYIFPFFLILYLFLFCNFLYQYFARLPIAASDGWFLHQRILARYIHSSREKFPDLRIEIITPESKFVFYKYLFFSGNYKTKKQVKENNVKIASGNYFFNNMKILNHCPALPDTSKTVILDVRIDCPLLKGKHIIPSIFDAGGKYTIINDKLCDKYVNKPYPLIKDLKYLDLETISDKDFCQNFIISSNDEKN